MKNYYKQQLNTIELIKHRNIKPSLLLHTCCAMCFSSTFMQIKDFFNITVFFFNPNIYPIEEYEKRKIEVIRLINIFNNEYQCNIKFIEEKEDFALYNEKRTHLNKCVDCLNYRLLKSMNYAFKNDYDYVSTTLTVGRLKDSYLINSLAETLIQRYTDLKYFFSDFKKNKGIDLSLSLKEKYNIYAQNYCGCEKYDK